MRFRIRSSLRDETADASRIEMIERSVLKAVADAESERKGLDRRLETERTRLSMLMGNELFDYQEREPRQNQLLGKVERAFEEAEARRRQLTVHMAHLRRVLELLKQK